MRRALLACLLAGCYHASNLACAVSCENGQSCPAACSAGCPITCATPPVFASARRSTPAMPLRTGHWTHVACVYDGTNLTVYVDGAKANADTTTGGAVMTGSMGGTGIGSQTLTQAQENHYVGLIDNVRIWSVARARADICADAAPNCH